jgi:hypothetical protein
MKTDRELLELAAKAAGLPIEFDEGTCNGWWPNGRTSTGDVDEWWNPLTDDGDALRLAVKLRLQVHIEDYGTSARLCEGGQWQSGRSSDPAEATRRAIVRAAAASSQESPA